MCDSGHPCGVPALHIWVGQENARISSVYYYCWCSDASAHHSPAGYRRGPIRDNVLAPFTPANPHGTQMGTWRAEAGQRFPSLVVWTSIPVCNICKARGGDGNHRVALARRVSMLRVASLLEMKAHALYLVLCLHKNFFFIE
jgi:hypothetical protein